MQDVVKSMIILMKSGVTNKRFIVVSENKSYRTIFSEIASAFGKKEPYIKISRSLSEIAWRIAAILSRITGSEPLLTRHASKSIHKKSHFLNTKILSVTGLEFNSINSVIKRVCSNFEK